MATYFISDLHFGHKNCLAYDARPWVSVEDHDEALIRNWNSVVGVDDDVYILGDISWYGAMKTIELFERMNGTKHLVAGNHDKKLLKNPDVRALFAEVVPYKEIQLDDKYGIVLCHYPIPTFNHHYYGWYHLYGHVHTSFEWNMTQHTKLQMEELYGVPCHMYNVGCMVPGMDYTPRTLDEILQIFGKTEVSNNGERKQQRM